MPYANARALRRGRNARAMRALMSETDYRVCAAIDAENRATGRGAIAARATAATF